MIKMKVLTFQLKAPYNEELLSVCIIKMKYY